MTTTGSIISQLAGAILGITLTLLLHRHYGIYHDSILYMGQTLAQVRPEIMSRDLFFLHGSQSSFSILPWILGKLSLVAGIPTIFMLGTLSALLLFAFSSWYALSALLPARQRYWAWLGVLCLPSTYGAVRIFSYSENFLTPRPFAESFCLLCIGLLARKQWRTAGICLLLALLLHPLQGIAGILIIWPWAVMQDRRWLHAAWLAVPVLTLALFGVQPFDGLLQRTDAAWLKSLGDSWQLFILEWEPEDYRTLAFDILLLAAGWRLLGGALGKWCAASLCGLVLGLGASLVLVDGLHLVLPTSLQLWRVHWLAHLFGVAAFAALLLKHVRDGDAARSLLLALVALLAWSITPVGWLETGLLYLVWPWLVKGPRARLKPYLGGLFALCLVLLFVKHIGNEWELFSIAGYRLDLYPIDIHILKSPIAALGLPLFGAWAWQRSGAMGRRALAAGLLVPLLVLAALRWDARRPQVLAFEQAAGKEDIFGMHLPDDAQVFWEPESLVGNWLVLGRASYFSYSHLAGQMFNRGTFADGRAREARMLPLMQEGTRCRERTARGDDTCHISPASLHRACMPGKTPAPDFLVLPYAQPQQAAGEWRVPSIGRLGQQATFRIFSCTQLLHEAGSS